jgi:hypothetical protein
MPGVDRARTRAARTDYRIDPIRWADPVTAVGVRLTASDHITVLAPHGLSDLFALIVRPNLAAPDAARVYRARMTQKRWAERWPKLTILWPKSRRDAPARH